MRLCLRAVLSLLLAFAWPGPARTDDPVLESVAATPRTPSGSVPIVSIRGFDFDAQNRPVVSWSEHDPAGGQKAYWSRRHQGSWTQTQFWEFCCLNGTHSHATTVAGNEPFVVYAAPTAWDFYGVYVSGLNATPTGDGAGANVEGTGYYREPQGQSNVFKPSVAPGGSVPSYARSVYRELGILNAARDRRTISTGQVNNTEFDYVAGPLDSHHVLYAPWLGGTDLPMSNGIYYWDGTDGSVGVRLESASDGHHLSPALGIDRAADGTLHAVVSRSFGELGNLERYLFHYTSSDGGGSWNETLLAGAQWSGLHTPPGFGALALRHAVPVQVAIKVGGDGTPWIAYVTIFDDPANPQPNEGGGINDFGVWLAHPEGGVWTHARVASFSGDGHPAADLRVAVDDEGVPAVLFHHKQREELVLARAGGAPVPPLGQDDAVTTNEDAPVEIRPLDNDTGASPLEIESVGTPDHGTAVVLAGGVVRYSPAPDYFGPDAFSYSVRDEAGLTATATIRVDVAAINDHPLLDPIPNRIDAEGSAVDFQLSGSDPDGDSPLTFSIAGVLPPGIAFDAAAGRFHGTIGFDAGPGYSIEVTLGDPQGARDVQSFFWQMVNTNRPPVVSNPGPQTSAEGQAVLLQVPFNDADVFIPCSSGAAGPPCPQFTIAIEGLPQGMIFGQGSEPGPPFAAIVGGAAHPGSAGTYPVILSVTDPDGATTSVSFPWTITGPAACTPVAPGLIAWWRGEGDAQDQVGTNHGAPVNGPGFAPGRVGQAFDFAATNAHFLVGDTDELRVANGFSLTAWVRPAAAPTTDTGTWLAIVTKWNQSVPGDAWGLWITNTGGGVRAASAVGDAVTADTGLHGGTVPIGQWSHLAATYDPATGQHVLFVNGAEVARRTRFGGTHASATRVMIGREDSGIPRPFRGSVDEPAVYGRALSAAEVSALFQAGAAGACPPPPNAAPVLAPPANQTNLVGDNVTVSVQAEDPDGDALSYTASGLPPGLSIDAASGLISGTLAGGGSYAVTVRASDGRLADEATFTWIVQAAPPALSITNVSVTERDSGTTAATFAVSLSAPSTLPVSVTVATRDGSAVAGRDYVGRSPFPLTFAPGTTSRTVTVRVMGDRLSEAAETFFVELSSASNAAIATARGTATIADDDPLPRVSIGNALVFESDSGARSVSLTVRLSAASGQTVSVDYATSDGSAAAPGDYRQLSGTLHFPAGTLTRTLTLAVTGDRSRERREVFFVNLANPSGAVLGDAQARVVILDDDRFAWLRPGR